MEGYSPLKAHPFFESITWENLHHQTPPKLTAYLPAMSEDDEDCYGNVSALADVRTNLCAEQFCLSHCVKVVPLSTGSLSPRALGLRFVGGVASGEASRNLVVGAYSAAPQSESHRHWAQRGFCLLVFPECRFPGPRVG